MTSLGHRPSCARAFYLELCALGIDLRTGAVPELRLSCAEIAQLMRRLRENREELHEVLVADDAGLEAIRREGAAYYCTKTNGGRSDRPL